MIDVRLPVGQHILAISGGLDSMVLLHLASLDPEKNRFVVAHFDHGIRDDSAEDMKFVKSESEKIGMVFESKRVELGENASEEQARVARYQFLHELKDKYKATSIVTAHHQDDRIETAIINLLRGTGNRGLSALRSHPHLVRPFLHIPKIELVAYAKSQNISWREDTTNSDEKYLRNKIRKIIKTNSDAEWQNKMIKAIDHSEEISNKIDTELAPTIAHAISKRGVTLPRALITSLDHALACELFSSLMKHVGIHDISSSMIERVVIMSKVGRPGTSMDIDKRHKLLATKRSVRIVISSNGKTLRV
jgi:tRNA(Ile)-lysidine synthase